MKTVAVIGASRDRAKYGNKAVRAYKNAGYLVFPVNPREDEIEGLVCYPSIGRVPLETLDLISVYVPPEVGIGLLSEAAAKNPAELWLNPGADSPEVVRAAEQLELNVVQACSIISVGGRP